jgi:hypothetical protein
MRALAQVGPDLTEGGTGTAGITPHDQLAVFAGDQAIVLSLDSEQMRELAAALMRAAKRLDRKERRA